MQSAPIVQSTSPQPQRGTSLLNVASDPADRRCLAFVDDATPVVEAAAAEPRYAIELATTDEHHHAALLLLRKLYQWRGYTSEDAHREPTGVTVIASQAGRVVATMTVGYDSDGLAVESLYPEEVAQFRRDGHRLCEFTRLAVDREGHSIELLAQIFHVAYMYAHLVKQATHLLAEVNPRHVGFYSRMLGFRVAGPVRTCARVQAPAVLLSLPLVWGSQQIATFGGRLDLVGSMRSLYPYFFGAHDEQRILHEVFGAELRRAQEVAAVAEESLIA